MKHGATEEYTKSVSFEQLVIFLREKKVINLAKQALRRVHFLSTFRHGSPSRALVPENVNVRVFLAGFMIAYRPTHVFESMGRLEQALFESATPLIKTFEEICKHIMASKNHSFAEVPHELTSCFPTLLFDYLKNFKAWKVPDEAKLTCRIKHALIALYQAEEHLPPDEPEDSKLKTEFRTQIERLRSKLQQIAGVDTLNRFDEERRAGTVHSGINETTAAGSGGAYAALPGRMTNEQLAHELLMDPTFQLDESGGCSVENPVFHRIRESFHQAFWDSLVDDLKLATPCYVRVLRVLSEIRDGISDLAGSREAGSIAEAVDLSYINQQAEAGLYDWDSCQKLVSTIVAIVMRVQAPKRDDETKAKWKEVEKRMKDAQSEDQPRELCKALEFLLDRVNAMRIDAANARLRLIAPVIKDHGIDYERGKFQDKLNDGTLTLERTTSWINDAVSELVTGRHDVLHRLLEGEPSEFVKVHCEAVLSIVTERKIAPRAEAVPETLMMDIARLQNMRKEFDYIAEAATVMVAVTSVCRPPEDVMRSVSNLAIELDAMDVLTDRVDMELQPHVTEEVRRKARESINDWTRTNSPVRKLMEGRIRSVFRTMVLTGEAPGNLRQDMRTMLPRIKKVASKLTGLCNLNRTVHLPTYNKLIEMAARGLRNAN